jgi:diguanylate cyclase (GGDEF)-like protein
LQEFAKRCKNLVREVDLIGRYGGEELIILLPETDGTLSMQVAERLRNSIACTPIRVFDREIFVTASIGVASQDENTMDLETLIARADQAMYIAKHKGRNCVAMSK